MEEFVLNIRIGMKFNEEIEDVEVGGVTIQILDENNEEIDLGMNEDTINQLAKELMRSISEGTGAE